MIKCSEKYKMFNGWYRVNPDKKDAVWHLICNVYPPVPNDNLGYNTICGRNIDVQKCDFSNQPKRKCINCERHESVGQGTEFAPVGSSSILTRSSAISEIKRLLKDRIYYLAIWGKQGVKIIAKWESGLSIDIYSYPEEISPQRKNNVMSLAQIQVDLGRFQSSVNSLCKKCDILALEEKKKNSKKGKLTKEESCSYFEKIFYEAEN